MHGYDSGQRGTTDQRGTTGQRRGTGFWHWPKKGGRCMVTGAKNMEGARQEVTAVILCIPIQWGWGVVKPVIQAEGDVPLSYLLP